MKVLLFGTLFVATIAGYAAIAMESDQKIAHTVIVEFAPGQAVITPEAKEQLNQLIKNTRGKRRVHELQIAAWSDNDYPKGDSDLSKSDIELARLRGQVVKNYLRRPIDASEVTNHNMAERSNWLSQLFKTDDATLKKELSRSAGVPMSNEEFRLIRENGKPSSAVILTVVKR